MPRTRKTPDFRELFESDSEAVLALTQRVFDKCILDKLRPPTDPLLHTWVQPGGTYYVGQWIWDTMFVVDLLSLLPNQKDVIRGIFQNYWDFQDRWNRQMPAYAHHMVTVAIKHGINEHYDSLSGKPLGVPDYCMSCTLVTMMLDGLAQRHRLQLREKRPAQ